LRPKSISKLLKSFAPKENSSFHLLLRCILQTRKKQKNSYKITIFFKMIYLVLLYSSLLPLNYQPGRTKRITFRKDVIKNMEKERCCIKCGSTDASTDEVAMTSTGLSKLFDEKHH